MVGFVMDATVRFSRNIIGGPMLRLLSSIRSAFRRAKTEAPATYWLLLTNLVVYLAITLRFDAESIFTAWGLTPVRLVDSPSITTLSTVFTSMFLHAGWLHIGANMLMLWVFGRLLERQINSRRFVALYFASGTFAALAQFMVSPMSGLPMVGASGALSGVLGAAVCLAPSTRLWVSTPITLFIPVPMRLAALGVIWMGLQVLGLLLMDPIGGGIAYAAHLGGFLAGYGIGSRGWRYSSHRSRKSRNQTGDVRVGSAPSAAFSTFFVTDSRGRTYTFHSPKG